MSKPSSDLPYTRPEDLVQDFVTRGLVILAPESLGVPDSLHEDIYARERSLFRNKIPIQSEKLPEITRILRAPGLKVAVDRLLGPDWAIVPYTHNAPFASGPFDQHWHKDDSGPFNSRKQRHHQAVQIEMLYYPQYVLPDMGPTATIPYSQYWTFNHEENHDNFAGADHLDFGYQLTGMEGRPVSGPNSDYDEAAVTSAKTDHDQRMRNAVEETGWPLVRQFEAAPLRAGSVLLYSHNLFHRGNHRRDAFEKWREHPRFMWRFWLYRTHDPTGSDEDPDSSWRNPGLDALTGVDCSAVDENVGAVWRYHYHWSHSGNGPAPEISASAVEAETLKQQLYTKGDTGEPQRIGAAYRLAGLTDTVRSSALLEEALLSERENVRRAATYGLVALGSAAVPIFMRLVDDPRKWVRKAATYGLGEVAPLTEEVLDVLVRRLREDDSVYVRSVAAGSLGCLGRRALAINDSINDIAAGVSGCVMALIDSLSSEENRLGMDKAQGRSIKHVRPTDESDVCEGIGIDYGMDRFEPVRSAVRENALWSLVILCSHGNEVLGESLRRLSEELKRTVQEDRNVFCVGFALDCLKRLGREQDSDFLSVALNELSVRPWEALTCAGLSSEELGEYFVEHERAGGIESLEI